VPPDGSGTPRPLLTVASPELHVDRHGHIVQGRCFEYTNLPR
jgi:hypothetical protein